MIEDQTADSEFVGENALRPQSLTEFIGQEVVREQLITVLSAAQAQQRAADHILFSGPPGLGKTTLAMIVANETGARLRITSGPSIQHGGDMAAILASLAEGEVLFIDEIHRLSRPVEEMLYLAMEDRRIDIVIGKGPGATAVPLELPPFTLVGATTKSGALPAPLRDRFGFTAHMDFYDESELAQIIRQSAMRLSVAIDDAAVELIAKRGRGTPRVANRLLARARDLAVVEKAGKIGLDSAERAMKLFGIDALGLDRMDLLVLNTLSSLLPGQAMGLKTLANQIGESSETVEDAIEPYLLRSGLIIRSSRGRQLSDLGRQHLGL